MYYESYERPRRRRRRRKGRGSGGCAGWLLGFLARLILLALALSALAGAALYVLPVGLMNVEPAGMELSPTDGLPGDRLNVLLLGLDALDATGQRSDAILVASIGADGVRLSSLMRDTLVDIPGNGRQKINAAYAIGGPELAMRTVNQTFQLNITNYISTDFRALVDAIDALGGVDVEVKASELPDLNHYAYDTFVKISRMDAEKYAHYADSTPITATGKLHLNGLFATSYCRIRHSDSDYMRTSRQREVLRAMLERLRQRRWDPRVYVKLFLAVRGAVQTNLYLPELISLGEKALLSGEVDTFRLPMEPYLYDNGSTIEITDLEASVRALHEFIYAK